MVKVNFQVFLNYALTIITAALLLALIVWYAAALADDPGSSSFWYAAWLWASSLGWIVIILTLIKKDVLSERYFIMLPRIETQDKKNKLKWEHEKA